jgi:predicted lipid-binding transport protein (Tim44 family)
MGQPHPPGTGQVIDIRPGISRPQITNQPPGIAAIMEADPAFSPDAFLAGARGAFEMILRAFAEGDEATLRGLLETQVFESFSGAIRARKEAGETCANTLDGIERAEIAEATLSGAAQARITVRFVSKQRHATRDAEGKVIDGDPDHPHELVDLWTFTRDQRSRDPNWHLAATSTPEE